jgi:large subunit ribosomal protein L19
VTIQLIQDFEKKYKNNVKYNFDVGDTIRVHTKIIEGEKERVQVFTGVVVSMKGKGLSKTITIYRNAYGCSMERVFLINSPKVTKIELEKKGKVRRSKLYFLRGESGKKAKIEEQILAKEDKGSLEKTLENIEVKPEEKVQEPIEEKQIEDAKPIEEKKEMKKSSAKKVKKEKKEE